MSVNLPDSATVDGRSDYLSFRSNDGGKIYGLWGPLYLSLLAESQTEKSTPMTWAAVTPEVRSLHPTESKRA